MHFPPFNHSKSRYERKFVVNDMHYHEIIQHIRNNRAAFDGLYEPRYINNIYFDTNDIDYFYDNISGKGSRKKARIRWYGELMGNVSTPVLEFKLREGMVGNKISFPLKPFTLDNRFTVELINNIIRESNLPNWAESVMLMLKPALLNRYHRQYFISFNNEFRLTLDDELTYYGMHSGVNNFMEKHNDNSVIVELKYDTKFDGYESAHIANELPFRLSKSSKYVNGFEFTHPSIAT